MACQTLIQPAEGNAGLVTTALAQACATGPPP